MKSRESKTIFLVNVLEYVFALSTAIKIVLQAERNALIRKSYARFLKGGRGAENLGIMKTKRKVSPLRISPFFCPKLGEDQKKKKKKVTQIRSVSVLKLSAQVTKAGGHGAICILFYTNYTILANQRGEPWHHAPLNTPLIRQ